MFKLMLFTGGMLILGFLVFIITEYISRRELINKNRLRSVAITYNVGDFLGLGDLRNITHLVNKRLLSPYGESDSWLNKPIDVKDIVSIAPIPMLQPGKIQIVVWYIHRYQNVVEQRPSKAYNDFNPYRSGWR